MIDKRKKRLEEEVKDRLHNNVLDKIGFYDRPTEIPDILKMRMDKHMTKATKKSSVELGDMGDKTDRHHTWGLPQTGHEPALDDDEQPEGSGSKPSGAFSSESAPPLKDPMKPEDIARPKIREGVEASAKELRRLVVDAAVLDPRIARRIAKVAESMSLRREDLTTAALPEVGQDDANDDTQDKGHGVLEFYGTSPAKSDQLTEGQEVSRTSSKIAAVEDLDPDSVDLGPEGFKLLSGPNPLKAFDSGKGLVSSKKRVSMKLDNGEEITLTRPVKWGKSVKAYTEELPEPSSLDNSIGDDADILDPDSVDLGQDGFKKYASTKSMRYEILRPRNMTASQLNVWRKAVSTLINSGKIANSKGEVNYPLIGSTFKKLATGNCCPTMQDPEQDVPPAPGTGAFADESKKPLTEMTNPGDVKTPKIREASKKSRVAGESVWSLFKKNLLKRSRVGGKWNEGSYRLASENLGNVVEITAEGRTSDGYPITAGSVTFTLVHDSPSGRYATIEITDGALEHRQLQQSLEMRDAQRFASSWVTRLSEAAKNLLD